MHSYYGMLCNIKKSYTYILTRADLGTVSKKSKLSLNTYIMTQCIKLNLSMNMCMCTYIHTCSQAHKQ